MEMSDWQLNEQVLNENDIPNMRGEFKFFLSSLAIMQNSNERSALVFGLRAMHTLRFALHSLSIS